MLQENSLFGTVDKVAEAIELLQKHEPPEGYYVAFSGGKDSVVILDLVKRAGVKYEAHHHIMTIEPPELMQFIFKQYPEVINDHPLKTIHQLIVRYGFPPIRIVRYCCWELKVNNGNNRIKVTGVRAEESPRRAKYPKVEIKENSGELRLIHDWTAAEVWEYIRARNLAYCKLYDEGKKRIGCVFCPFARERENIENALKYPQFVRYFITACDRAIKNRLAKGKESKYKTGAEMFVSWIEGVRGKKLKDFGVKFDFEKGEIVMENEETSTTAVVSTENGSSEGNLPAENSNAVKTTPTLEQRVVKIQFHLQNMAQSAIIIGQELTECKKEVGHGNWADWLKKNFNLSQRTARQFMQIYERFGANSKWQTSAVFNYSQMAELLALPAGEEENFIVEKAAEGSPVEDMTVKKLRKEIKDWKKKAAEKETEAESLKKENEELKKDNAFKLEVNRSNAEEYFKLRAEKEKEISELQDKINALQKQLENPTVEILPADDEEKENLRKEVAALKAREENFREEIATSQALNQFFMMANFLQEHHTGTSKLFAGSNKGIRKNRRGYSGTL